MSVEEYERKKELLNTYQIQEKIKIPNGPFAIDLLTEDVVNAYGICPFLNLNLYDSEDRLQWLHNLPDKGQVFRASIISESPIEMQPHQDTNLFSTMDTHINDMFSASKYEFTLNDIEREIKTFRETRSKTKALRENYQSIMNGIDRVYHETGINLIQYFVVKHKWNIRFRYSEGTIFVNPTFTDILSQLQEMHTSKTLHDNTLQNQKEKARELLIDLIEKNFRYEQTGRYFKKWSVLTVGQKEERVKSYITWYYHDHGMGIRDSVINNIVQQIFKKIKSKEFTNFTWCQKTGMITNIAFTLDNDKVNFIGAEKKSIVRKKTQHTLQKHESTRLNRLLLSTILECHDGQLNKQKIVKMTIDKFNPRYKSTDTLTMYLNATYAKMTTIIKANPLFTS